MSAGYSGTPLAKKLGIKQGFKILLYKQPMSYFDLFSDLPDELTILKSKRKQTADFIHLFCMTMKELEGVAEKHMAALKKTGMMWISWPKGSSEIETDLKRDPIREYLLDLGFGRQGRGD